MGVLVEALRADDVPIRAIEAQVTALETELSHYRRLEATLTPLEHAGTGEAQVVNGQ